VERHFDHADRAFDQFCPGRDHSFGLLAAQHCPCDFLSIGKVGETAFVNRDPGHGQPRDQLGAQGADVGYATYEGGHGWHGDVFGLLRAGFEFLAKGSKSK